MTLLVEKGFREEDFAKIHPGGKLGKKLMRVDQLMHAGADAPIVHNRHADARRHGRNDEKTLGMTCVVNASDELAGIITDGDLRRFMVDNARRLETTTAGDVMTRRPIVIDPSTLAAQALLIMEQRKITSLVVGGPKQSVAGVIHLHHLWRTELF